MIDALATERHFRDHIQPVWDALPAHLRGMFHTEPVRLGRGDTTLVASYGDLKHARDRQAIFLEHGAGQSYGNRSGNYAGGWDRDNVVMFLSPNATVAARNRARYPKAGHAIVGCPKLDKWWPSPHALPESRVAFKEEGGVIRQLPPTVAISFHWDAQHTVPEMRSAFSHYQRALPTLLGNRWNVIGHAHPKMLATVQPFYEQAGIEVVPDFEDVLRRADVYVCDNSSTLFEFAATGRPVVVLNAPWYRRDVELGLRFWEFADVGRNVDEPEQLVPTINRALMDSARQAQRRREITEAVYAVRDGTSAQQAANVIAWRYSQEAAA